MMKILLIITIEATSHYAGRCVIRFVIVVDGVGLHTMRSTSMHL